MQNYSRAPIQGAAREKRTEANDPHASLTPRDGVLILSGYGVRVAVERGHLVVNDGTGRQGRQGQGARSRDPMEEKYPHGRRSKSRTHAGFRHDERTWEPLSLLSFVSGDPSASLCAGRVWAVLACPG